MGTIVDILYNFTALDTDAISEAAVDETKESLQELNKQQLLAGYNKNGQLIGKSKPYRNEAYAFYKANLNPLPGLGNPDLRDTGAFFEGFETEVSGEYIIQDSTDPKGQDLEEKYPNIFGLGGKFKQEYIEENLQPAFQRQIEKATGLKFS